MVKELTNILIFASIMFSTNIEAQENSDGHYNEIYFSYGSNFLPFTENEDLAYIHSRLWPTNHKEPGLIDMPTSVAKFIASKGGITIGLNRRIKRNSIGGFFYYEPQMMTFKTRVYNFDPNTGISEQIGFNSFSESKVNIFGLGLRYEFHWINRKKLKMYSGLSAGAYLRHSKSTYFLVTSFQDDFPELLEDFLRYKDSEYHLLAHVNLLGIRYGGDKWAVLLETGMGNRGYVNIGVSMRLGGNTEK